VRLVLWILAWDVHVLATAPLGLFDANIFFPAAHTLALSEHLLGVLPIYAPIAIASGSPVFAHQATLLLTFVGAFVAGFALVRAWTGSAAAALLAGSLFAFSPFRGGHLGGLHILGGWYLPLAVLLLWRSATTPGRGAPIGLAVVVALVGLQSMYLAYAVLAGLGALLVVLFATDAGARARWGRLVGPVAAAGAIIAASAVPYLFLRASGALPPPPRPFVEAASTRLGHTGATGALVLAVLTCPWWRRGLRPTVRGSWLLALAGAALATHLLAAGPTIRIAGTRLPGPYRLAAVLVPGFASLRIPLRLDAFTTAALATLAAVGVAGVLATLGAPVRRGAAAVVVLLAVAAARAGLPHPVPLEPIETRATLPPIYAALANATPGPLLELPWHDFVRTPDERGAEAVRVYRSVYHWRRLLNGYSGYAPPSYALVGALVDALPAPQAVRLLARTTGLRQVLLHGAEMAPAVRARWAAAGDGSLAVGTRTGDDVLLTLVDPPPPDLLPRVRALARGPMTLTGTPLAALPPDGRRATVRVLETPSGPLARNRRVRLVLEIANASRRTWPALAYDTTHRVAIAARWDPVGAKGMRIETEAGRVPWDLEPGEAARVVAVMRAPETRGAWRLTIGPAQDGVWLDGAGSLDVRVR
jgi:hypothetical protein